VIDSIKVAKRISDLMGPRQSESDAMMMRADLRRDVLSAPSVSPGNDDGLSTFRQELGDK
jgi:hypothetical protein